MITLIIKLRKNRVVDTIAKIIRDQNTELIVFENPLYLVLEALNWLVTSMASSVKKER